MGRQTRVGFHAQANNFICFIDIFVTCLGEVGENRRRWGDYRANGAFRTPSCFGKKWGSYRGNALTICLQFVGSFPFFVMKVKTAADCLVIIRKMEKYVCRILFGLKGLDSQIYVYVYISS